MGKQMTSLFNSFADGNFILLPLVYGINVITFMIDLNKAGWEKFATLMGTATSILEFCFWAGHFLITESWNVVFGKMKRGRGSAISSSTSLEYNASKRALGQILGLVNDTPSSSDKYEFTRALAEKLIMKSLLKGDKSLRETNRAALESAFFRTIDLLTISLEEVCHQQELKDGSWFWALIHSLFLKNVGAIQQKLSLECILTYLFSILFGSVKSSRTARELIGASTINMKRSNLNTVAEKLVCELLWVTEKLKDGSTLNEAARSWATLHTLAKLSLSAHSRIQACLLRISVMLLKESTLYGPDTYSSNLKVNILLLWLPLFCNVKIGFDYPCLTPSEKADFFRDLEQIVLSLSVVDQERVLTCWLREYISSTSEWPNLQECFENWYFSAKKPSDMAAL